MLQTRNDTSTISDRLSRLVDAALGAGADAAEAVFAESQSLSVGVRAAQIETVERDETQDLGLRVFVGQKQAVVSISEFSPQTLERTIERALIMARISPDDPYTGLADPATLHRHEDTAKDLQLVDSTDVSAEAFKERALACEAAGLSYSGITTDSASAGYSRNTWQILTSGGFSGQHSSSVFFQSARMIATDANGQMERDGEGRSKRFYADLPSPESTGTLAAERALSALGARRIDSTRAAVIFDPRVSKSILGLFLGAISGPSIARGSSYLKDRMHTQVFSRGLTIVDDPFRVRGLASAHFDDEGVRVHKRNLIDDGTLTTWLLNTASARQLGLKSTGHASRGLAGPAGTSAHNVTLLPGLSSQPELMRDAGKGFLVTSMFGPNVNPDTGDWSVGASGFWFEGGEVQFPINEMTIAGNLIDIFARLIPGSDLEIKGSTDAPSILVDGLSLGGEMTKAPAAIEEELALLVDKVRRAGALALHVKAQGLMIDYKSDGSVVTNADLEVNLWLKEALMQARPDYGWQSEESPDTEARLGKSRIFVLDPIDGTMGLTKGSPYWTIALSIVDNGRPIAGVVYAPDAQELYAAGLGLGATLNGEPIRASAKAALEGAHVIGDSRIFSKNIWQGVWPKMLFSSRPSVAYRMACVAAGRVDFTLALTPKRDWDVAAATLIATEAGAQVSDHLGNPYHFNGKSSLKPSLVCACGPLYADIIRRCGHLSNLDTI